MDRLRKLRLLRGLIFVVTAVGAVGYALGPMRNAFWKPPAEPAEVCGKLGSGEVVKDRWGTPMLLDPRIGYARSAGPDKVMNTSDDVLVGCN